MCEGKGVWMMRILQGIDREFERETATASVVPEAQGLAGWLLGLWRAKKGERGSRQRRLRLVETLALGGKRQLMLVECGGASFLVGGGFESVHTIMPLHAADGVNVSASSADEACR